MGSSGIPINIGSYCSDFVIQDPVPQTFVGCFRRIDSTTNRIYYLIVNQSSSFQEVEHPIIQPQTSYVLNDFQLNVHWDKTIRPVVENGVITPQNILRYVSSNSRPTPSASNIIKFDSGSIILRSSSNPATTQGVLSLFPFSSVSSGQYTVTYNPSECPYTLEKGSLVYLVNDNDDNKSIVTSTTQKRYLIIAPPKPLTIGYLDLFKPEVTESMLKQTVYRINKQTSLADGTVRYSFDVFRENISGNTPTENSATTYREIGLTYSEFTIDPNDVRGTTADGFKDTKITHTMSDGSIVKYVSTPEVMDKTISDLYGEMSLGLFKLVENNADTDMYLGYECTTAGQTSCTTKQLVVRNYFNYMKPSASCQFRMYDLGNKEYMMIVTDPSSDPPTRYVMRPTSSGTIRFDSLTTITKEERGWQLEEVNGASKTVRILWKYPSSPLPGAASSPSNIYISVNSSKAVQTTLSLLANASTFICIRCSRIEEETGTCASINPMYVDDDLNYLTSPILVSPTPVDLARGSPVPIETNLIFSKASGNMRVTDDGVVSYVNDGSESSFITTRTGILTYGEKISPSSVVFIAKRTATGEYIYARYVSGSPPNLKFVAATNPNISDGFGWRIVGNTITAVIPTSPQPRSPVIPEDFSGITILRDFTGSVDSTTYRTEEDDYLINFNTIGTGKTFSVLSDLSGSGKLSEIVISGSTATARVRATQPISPVRSPPTFSPNNTVNVRGTVNGNTSTVTIVVPPPQNPVLDTTVTVPSVSGITQTGITIRGVRIQNMNNNGTATFSLRAVGSPGSPSTSPVVAGGSSTLYSDLAGDSFLITGLVPNTRYSAPSFMVTNTKNNLFVGFTISGNFTTSILVNAAYMNGGADNKEFYMRVGSNYVKINSTGSDIEDTNIRFWQTPEKSQASRFIVDTTKTYSSDPTYKAIKLASYYNGTSMTTYTTTAATRSYLRNFSDNWIYKDSYKGNTIVDFHWKFEDATGGMKIRNSSSLGLRFAIDSTVNKLKSDSFSSADTFIIEFSDGTVSTGGGGGGGGGTASTDPFISSGTVSNSNIRAVQLSRDGRTGYINFTPNQNPGPTQNCTAGSGRVNITSNTEFAVGKALKFLDGDSNIVAVVTSRFDGSCYIEVTFYRLSGGVYSVDTSYPSGTISINTTDSRIQHGRI